MDALVIVGASVSLIIGIVLVVRNRAPKFKGLTEQDFLNVSKGIVHPELEAACQRMLTTISERVTGYYRTPRTYTGTVQSLVQVIDVVDSLPDGAGGAISRTAPGQPTTMHLVRSRLADTLTFQHELVHRVVWDDPQLTAMCAQYPANGYHWPVLFDPFGSH